ncbi:acetyltransferase [Paenibacillus methanolicus]|uniref:GNAT family N-acetyltransferase n=1 Tax=Paenibacillus methanolicus TaxID=582686 RepID=A0A5S5BY98_9BACL|nr:acetyltransferase [Paenibacillus methanolicus]TYP71994.1 hypothetical protein BCM02_109273 [Paenibacillus methanolicus]
MSQAVEASLALRVESAETNTVLSRLSGMRDLEGNPEQVYIERFGNARAFVVKGIPDPYFNAVRGLTSDDIDRLDDILAFYQEHQVSCRFDIPPFVCPDVLLKLAERGYYQSGFHSALYRLADGDLPAARQNEGIVVREMEDNEFNHFGEIYAKAFQMPEFLAPAVTKNNRMLKDKLGWHYFLATDHNVPAAVAVLSVQ